MPSPSPSHHVRVRVRVPALFAFLGLAVTAVTAACGEDADPVTNPAPGPTPTPTTSTPAPGPTTAPGPSTPAPAPEDLEPPTSQAVTSSLTNAGFQVQAGRFSFLDLSQCCATSCAGNNPSSPYGALYLPPAPGAAPEPNAGADGMSSAYRLRPDEAVVFLGRTPPESRYFAFTPYLNDRAKPDGTRRIVAASLSESMNNLTLRTVGSAAGASVFGRTTAVIFAMSQEAQTAATNALVASGVPAGAINTVVFDPAVIVPGLTPSADTLGVLFRVALPTDRAALDRWIAQPGAQVYRMTPSSPPPTTTPLTVTPRPKDSTTTETALTPAVDRLRAAIIAANPTYEAVDLPADDGVPDPAACIAGTAVCAYDNRDTTYPTTPARILFQDDDDFYVVYGVNHQLTGKVSYANFSVYAVEHLVGLDGVASPSYPGSAQPFLGATDADAPKLYAWKIARSCGADPHCLAITKEACPDGIQNGKLGTIAFRTYLEPSTKTAPLPGTLVRDRVLRFRRR